MNDRYTFGDHATAAARLRRLAEIYEPVTRELLARGGLSRCGIAVDLVPGRPDLLLGRFLLTHLRDTDSALAAWAAATAPRARLLIHRDGVASRVTPRAAPLLRTRRAPRTWRGDEYATRSFDRAELDELDATLGRIVAGVEPAGAVSNVIRQIVAEIGPWASRSATPSYGRTRRTGNA